MQIIDVNDGTVVTDFISGAQLEQDHDEILRMEEAGRYIIFADNVNQERTINHPLVLDLLGDKNHPNITATTQLLEKLKEENFSKIRRDLIKEKQAEIAGDDNRRHASLLDVIKDDYDIDSVKPTKNNIEVIINGKKKIGKIEFGKAGDGKLKLNLEVILNFNNEENDIINKIGQDAIFWLETGNSRNIDLVKAPEMGYNIIPEDVIHDFIKDARLTNRDEKEISRLLADYLNTGYSVATIEKVETPTVEDYYITVASSDDKQYTIVIEIEK